jgi:hypothetical protein
LEQSEAAASLRDAYVTHGIVGPTCHVDALHAALATVARCDAIVSWNFRHIVHFGKIRLYNGINLVQGYPPIAIHSPREVIGYDD